jgi:ketosteroid isomerase-like protein
MAAEDDVRQASAKFYKAINGMVGGDASQMADAWSRSDTVTAMHPIGGRNEGWDSVRDSFAGVGTLASAGKVELADQRLQVGTDLAYEIGIERGWATLAGERIVFEQRVTNVYRLEDGQWKMVHHHTDLSPAMLDLLARLQAAA